MTSEVAVVGGGPAGSLCALYLSRLGHDVVAIDCVHHRPAWVELVSPQAVLALGRAACSSVLLQECGMPCRGIVDTWHGRGAEFQDFELTQCSPGWVVHRERFDAALRRLAELSGVRLLSTASHARLHGDPDLNEVELQLADRSLRASFLIDATGGNNSLMPRGFRRRLRFDRLVALGLSHTGYRGIVDSMLLTASSAGWWYSVQIDRNTSFTVLLTDGDLLPKQPIALQRLFQQQFHEAFGDDGKLYVGALSGLRFRDSRTSCAQRLWRGRWLRIGDAAFSVDPISGSGLAQSFQAAETAATCVSEFLRSGRLDGLQEFATRNVVSFAKTLERLRVVYAGRPRGLTGLAPPFWCRRTEANAFRVPV